MSRLTEEKEITYAFNVINDFFDHTGLYHAIKDTEHLIRSAANSKVYKKRIPGDLLCFKESFEELAAAAFAISSMHSERDQAIIEIEEWNQSPDISILEDFVLGAPSTDAFEDFPRSLTCMQYFNPYKAIKKFVSHMTELEWKKALKVLVEYALTNDPVDAEYPSYELMVIRLRMLQLIEACHLLHVRTNLNKKPEEGKIPKSKKK